MTNLNWRDREKMRFCICIHIQQNAMTNFAVAEPQQQHIALGEIVEICAVFNI